MLIFLSSLQFSKSYYNNTTILFTSNININKYIAKSIYIKLAHIILNHEFQNKLSMHQFQYIYTYVTNMKQGIRVNNSNI